MSIEELDYYPGLYTFDQYQKKTSETAIYPKETALQYTALGLAGEAGEVAGKVSKIIRDRNGIVTDEDYDHILKEVGDVLWFLSELATTVGFTLEDAAVYNLKKLADRKARGVLQGSGDNR